jgi:uncharacterized YigZ family protein
MFFVEDIFSTTYEIKKSKFISYLFPYSQFDEIMAKLKSENPKARHFVFAFRYLNEFEQIVERGSDDGEPKGTSGKPTLNVLSGANLINSAIITVRYFGGIKLGTGGLVKAYSNSANLVISKSKLKTYKKLETKIFKIKYSEISKFEYHITKAGASIISKDFDEVGGVFKVQGTNLEIESKEFN